MRREVFTLIALLTWNCGLAQEKLTLRQEFLKQEGQARELWIQQKVADKMLASGWNELKPIHVKAILSDGKEHRITYRVTADYLALSDSHESFFTPVTFRTAKIFLCARQRVPPTRKMIQQVFDQADSKLWFEHMPIDKMKSSDYFLKHNDKTQAMARTHDTGLLASGHKKEYALTPQLIALPNKEAIYGWFIKGELPDPLSKELIYGAPSKKKYLQVKQGLVLDHGQDYVDYSHGLRGVARQVEVDGGEPQDIGQVLADPLYSQLISDEGPFDIKKAFVCP